MVNNMKVVKHIPLLIYLIIVVSVTTLLFSFNKFGIAEINNKTIFETKVYKEGSLIIATKDIDKIKINDEIFYYNTLEIPTAIKVSKVTEIEKTNEEETTFTLDTKTKISSSKVIGKTKDAKIIPVLGTVLNILTSSLGYLLFIVLPILFLLIYLVYLLKTENAKRKSNAQVS